ncbi:MAG: TetR/AcrR family transcriptional regulator, partial [Paracoccaceae bacterium]|nr:TetR/AcrR family transcriptional regulator [Paracoccaceae bacterium]
MSSNIDEIRDQPSTKRPRGRPRGFEQTEVLEAAMRLFWARGYDAVSVDDLCRAMHVPRASLYAGYHDKEALFLAAVRHYIDTRVAPVAQAFAQGTDLADSLTCFFNAAIALATSEPDAPGCLVACVLADVAGANPQMRDMLAQHFILQESNLTA